MAIFIVENSGKVGYGIKRYICKTMEDIPVEVNGEEIAPGSKIYVTDEKKTYMLNTAGQWVEITEGGGGGSGGASALSDLTDVNLNELADGEYLVYEAESGMWKNGTGKDIYTELQGILLAGETTITLTSDFITTNSVIEDFVDDAFDGVEYVSREVTNGSVTYTFPEQSSDMPVMARVWIKGVGAAGVVIKDDEISSGSTWSSTKIAQELEKKVNKTEFADEYDNTSSYNEGDMTIYNNQYYINITAISEPGEEFDPTKWQEISLSDILANIDDKMDKVNPTGSGSFSLNRKTNTTIGDNSVAEGYETTASRAYTHAEGDRTIASGYASHAEGQITIASGIYSHAEGGGSQATGGGSHAEGANTRATGGGSHAEGGSTTAEGAYSHAEGYSTARGDCSHSEGYSTIAASDYQHAGGKYNVSDSNNTYAEIIGNGTADDARSNARTLDWQGNEVLAGDLTINGNQSVTQALNNIPSITIIPGTLSAGSTTVTISNTAITANSIIIPCVDEAFTGVAPTGQATVAGSVTLTFPVQSANMPVKVVVI